MTITDYRKPCGAEKVRIPKPKLGAKAVRVTHHCNRPQGHEMVRHGHVQYNLRTAEIVDEWR